MAKIIGNPTVTPMAVPDWKQTDSSKADFIKNKPDLAGYATQSELKKIIAFNDVVKKAECDDTGNNIRQTYAKQSDVITSYNGLSDKPITVLNKFPTNDELAKNGEGIYLAKVGGADIPDWLFFVSTKNDWTQYDNVYCRLYEWTIVIIGINGVRVEWKGVYDNFDDSRPAVTLGWREIPLNDNLATKDDIGNIETSLENIIAKYGLGGDSV